MLDPIRSGDLIDVVAPSMLCPEDILQAVEQILTQQGLRVRISKNIKTAYHLKHPRIIDVADCFQDFYDALVAPDSKAVWALRGGFGAMRILPLLQNATKPIKEKLFIGYSDATALHIFLQQKWHWQSIHGSGLASNAEIATYCKKNSNPTSADVVANSKSSIKKIITATGNANYSYDLYAINPTAKQTTELKAPVIGGNLSLICASLATSNQIEANNKILLVEEINDSPYRIERLFLQLIQANILNQVVAIVMGDFIDNNTTSNNSALLISLFSTLKIPCFRLPKVGHGNINLPIILGKEHSINICNSNNNDGNNDGNSDGNSDDAKFSFNCN